jgi:hypothetical protein
MSILNVVSDDISHNVNISTVKFRKMMFIHNALNDGWTVKRKSETYIFTKKHKNQRKVFHPDYLEKFILNNSSVTETAIDKV